MPNINENFVGRSKEIDTIVKVAKQIKEIRRTRIIISAMNGMAAIGKTTLAVHIADMLRKEYVHGQLYIDCYGYTKNKTPLHAEQILDSLLLSLKIPKEFVPNTFEDKVLFWRNYLLDKKFIVIFDNINSEKQIKEIMPSNTESLILITSRNRLTGFSNSYSIDVDLLAPDEAITLLEKSSGIKAIEHYDLFEKVAKKCGYLPLALQIIGSRMRGRKSIKFLERFVSSNNAIDNLETTENAVFESFELSYIMLNENEKNVLKLIAILPISNITPLTCSYILKLDETVAAAILDSLYEKSLITESGNDIYIMHDLLREFVCKKFDNENAPDCKLFYINSLTEMYLYLLQKFNPVLYPNDYCHKFKEFNNVDKPVGINKIPELLEWYDGEILNLTLLLEYLDKNDSNLKYIQCSHLTSIHLRRCLSSSSLLQIQQKALSYSRIFGTEYQALANNDVALAYMQVGDFKSSILHFGESSKLWKGKNLLGEANSLANHGFALERLGNYNVAIDILNEALKIHNTLNNNYGIAFVLNAIGAVTWRKKDYENAKKIFNEALLLRININDEIGISSTKNNLGFTLLKLNDPDKALKYFNESISISEKYNDYHGQSVTKNNLGYYNIYIKDFNIAIKCALKARSLAERVGDLYQMGRSYDVEAKAYIKLDNKAAAKLALEKAIEIFNKISVPELLEVKELLKNIK